MQVHRDVNGADEVVEVVGQEHTQVVLDDAIGDIANSSGGLNEAQVQLQVQVQPQLFDIDLERMHIDLYRDQYLTPDDFLDDIRKIVHNANVRVQEDPERLFRAQAMLTASEVSCQDFDANFRLECQRMATRELQRRAEYRKNREQNRTAQTAARDAQTPPVRRSARNNGQAPELSITDPLKLERRLKRARSSETVGEPLEEEGGDLHPAKRSRVSSVEMDGQESTADQGGIPAGPSTSYIDGQGTPHPPLSDFPSVTPYDQPIDMVVPALNGGFDPSLLNPVPVDPFAMPISVDTSIAPRDQQSMDLAPHPIPNGIPHAEQQASIEAVPHVPMDSQEAATILATESEPMLIERTPTPLPDFHADAESLAQLQDELHNLTEPLNVEELEQLRAMCLARLWNHRSDWDRSALIQELRKLVLEFVREVVMDDMTTGSPPFS